MGEATDKLKAAGNKLAGNVKESIGKATDNASLEAEGKAQAAEADVSAVIAAAPAPETPAAKRGRKKHYGFSRNNPPHC